MNNELANLRIGTAKTKTRGEVKGTSQALAAEGHRPGARRATALPVVGAAAARSSGPSPGTISYAVPRKVKRLAMRSILSLKHAAGPDQDRRGFRRSRRARPRTWSQILEGNLEADRQSTVIDPGQGERGSDQARGREHPWLSMLSYNRLRAHRPVLRPAA